MAEAKADIETIFNMESNPDCAQCKLKNVSARQSPLFIFST